MKKYSIMFNITLPYEVEIEANSAKEAREIAKTLPDSDILQGFAEEVLDYSNGDVEIESIMDEDGDYAYDGIGIL